MSKTVETMLEEYSPDQLATLLEITRQFKGCFSALADQMLVVGREKGLAEPVLCSALTTQCLLLAAWSWGGTREEFVEVAGEALDDAEKHRPAPDKAVQ